MWYRVCAWLRANTYWPSFSGKSRSPGSAAAMRGFVSSSTCCRPGSLETAAGIGRFTRIMSSSVSAFIAGNSSLNASWKSSVPAECSMSNAFIVVQHRLRTGDFVPPTGVQSTGRATSSSRAPHPRGALAPIQERRSPSGERLLASQLGPMEQTSALEIVRLRTMQRAGVVPHHQIADRPLVAVREPFTRCPFAEADE